MTAVQVNQKGRGGEALDLWNRWVLSLEWKAEGVIDGENEDEEFEVVTCARWGVVLQVIFVVMIQEQSDVLLWYCMVQRTHLFQAFILNFFSKISRTLGLLTFYV